MKCRHILTLVAATLASMFLIACSDNNGSGGGGGSDAPIITKTATPLALNELDAGSAFSAAVAVNNNGEVIGVSEDAAATMKAVLWLVDQNALTAGPPTMLSPLEGNTFSSAHGLNDAGVVVGKSQLGAETVPVVWAAAASIPTPLATLAATTSGAAYSINANGQIVGEGQVAAGGATHATFWNTIDGATLDLGTLAGGTFSSAYFISSTGIIVGESNDDTGRFMAVMWQVDAAGAITAGPLMLSSLNPDDMNSTALGVNAAGNIVGEVELATGDIQAVMWDAVTLAVTALGAPGYDSSASGINAAGKIAGWNNAGGLALAVINDIAQPPVFQLLLQDDATFSQAYGVSDSEIFAGISGDQAMVVIFK